MPPGDAERPVSNAPLSARDRRSDHGADAVVASASRGQQIRGLVRPFGGRVHCHAPKDRPFAYDALARADDGRDRWGASGKRTVYLAGDPAVALAEYARQRHIGAPADSRCLWSFRLQAVSVVDVRADAVLELFGLARGAAQLLDRAMARRLAGAVRDSGLCQGMIVPSMAYLDQPEQFNFVLFVERLGVDLEILLTNREAVGELILRG